MPANTIRIDKLLFFIRLAKSRTTAATWANAGHIRINRCRVERGSSLAKANDVITLPCGDGVITFRLLLIPARRGPPGEALPCYEILP